MRKLLYIIILGITIGSIFGCNADSKMDKVDMDSTEIPTMVTRDVDMLISDSGVIKYKVFAPIWFVYENDVTNKRWYFPEGIHLDQIDTTFQTEFSIEADTAYNYETKQLWHLIKNVVVHSTAGETFKTNELFWDQRRHEVYSDSLIHIERTDSTVLEGFGFKSNDAFTKYEIRTTSGIFPVQDKPVAGAQNDNSNTQRDSTFLDQAVADSIQDAKAMSELK